MTRTAPGSPGSIDHRRWLDFLQAQSYGKSIGPMPVRFAPREIPGLGREVVLDWDTAALLHETTYPPLASPVHVAPFWGRVQALLFGAFGALRYEPAHPYNPHRSYPSARCLFPVQIYLLDDRGAYRYDGSRHALRAVDGSSPHPAPADRAWIALVGDYTAIPEGYGPLRYALTTLEAGHALRSAVCCAESLGLGYHVHLAFPDEEILARLRLPGDGTWGPLAMLELAHVAGKPRLPDADSARTAAPASPASPDDIAALERASWLDTGEFGSWERERLAHASAGAGAAWPAPSGLPPQRLFDLLSARNAGRGAHGLSASSSTVPAALVDAAALAAAQPLAGGARTGAVTGIRLLVVNERVEGRADGIHEFHGGPEAVEKRATGRKLRDVQRGFSYGADVVNLASMNLAWMLVVDYPSIVARLGPRGLRLCQLEMGWMAQGLALVLASVQMFARPVRSYREDVLDEVLRLPPGEQVGYQVLCGLNRIFDASCDLRPPRAAHRRENPP